MATLKNWIFPCFSESAKDEYSGETVIAHHGFEIGKVIGEGSFSKIKIVSCKNKPYLYLAAKIVDTKKLEAPKKFINREVAAVCKMKHRYIVKICKIFCYPEKIYFFMEYCPGGSLENLVEDRFRCDEREARHYFRQILDALNYLHNKEKIAHRDLKLANVMLDSHKDIRLIDFGFCRVSRSCNQRRLSETFCGTSGYAAPEIRLHEPYNIFLADVWSLGILLFELVTGSVPYCASNSTKLLMEQAQGRIMFPVTTKLSQELIDIVEIMLQFDVTQRWNVKNLLIHQWVLKEESIRDLL